MTAIPPVRYLRARLAVPGLDAGFGDEEVAGLPEPAARHLRAAIAPGTPIARSARLAMRGRLKLGSRWLPFRAGEVLAPHHGFVWAARVAGVVSGSDHYADGHGGLDWKLLGVVRVAHAEGSDVARSAAARAAGEAVWLPTSLLPRFGVAWDTAGDDRLTVRLAVDDVDVTADLHLDDDGRLRTATFPRWGDPGGTGAFGWHPFGITVTGHGTFGGLTVPAAGRVGWYHGTDRFEEGEFFRYHLTDVRPVPPIA